MLFLTLCCIPLIAANLLTGHIKITPDTVICETTSLVDEICMSSNDTAVVTAYLDFESHGMMFTCEYTCTDENFDFAIVLNDFTYRVPSLSLGSNVMNVTITNSAYGYAMFLVNIIGMGNATDSHGLRISNMNLMYVDIPLWSNSNIIIIAALSGLGLVLTALIICMAWRTCRQPKYQTFTDVEAFM